MVKQYSIKFKRNALAHLLKIKRGQETFIRKREISNVRDLCTSLNISSYSLYKWEKELGYDDIEESDIEAMQFDENKEEELFEEFESMNGHYTMSDKKEDVSSTIFGIRYYSWFAKVHGIKDYSSLSLSQLKLQLGLKLLKESGLVPPIESSNVG